MNWKLILAGGLAFWLVTFAISFVTGIVIHGGILEAAYADTEMFWQPALRSDPPDMAALMPQMIAAGILSGFAYAAVFGWVRRGLVGPGWMRGLQFGLILTLFGAAYMLNWSGIFNLPDEIWLWWTLEQPLYFLPAGAVLGWVADKLVPLP